MSSRHPIKLVFDYPEPGQEEELENILRFEAGLHFGTPGSGDFTWSIERYRGSVAFTVDAGRFIRGLQEAKEMMYRQNARNAWHYTAACPDCLPADGDRVIVRLSDGRGIAECTYDGSAGESSPWLSEGGRRMEGVSAWMESQPAEVLLCDFLSDVLENLSFVPELEKCREAD